MEKERPGSGEYVGALLLGFLKYVVKVCTFTSANFRAVCSVFLGPCKLLVEAISVIITYMRLIETAA